MKFSHSFWLNQKGFEVNYATEAYKTTCTDNSITVLAANLHISNRGQTLGRPILEIIFSSKMKDVIKVSINHYSGSENKANRKYS